MKIYNTVVRPVIMYGSETWALRKREEQQLDRTEIRMLRWMLGISLRERRRNDDIRAEASVVAISEKIREAIIDMRREEEDPVEVAWRHPCNRRTTNGWKTKDKMERYCGKRSEGTKPKRRGGPG